MLFKNSPRNYTNISDLINHVTRLGGKGSDDIVQMLEAVNNFLSATEPETQAARDGAITDKKILSILTTVATALQGFSAAKRQDELAVQALDFGNKTIVERLNGMQQSGDKIHVYYATHDNPLKTFLLENCAKTDLKQ